jgi:cobalamin-dependent methionine synthase I
MLIVGELINASQKAIAGFIEMKDGAAIAPIAKDEEEAGTNYIDIKAGVFVDQEAPYLQWRVETAQSVVNPRCCIESPDPRGIESALSVHKGAAMINSISLAKNKVDRIFPMLANTDLKVVVLWNDDEGMPETANRACALRTS